MRKIVDSNYLNDSGLASYLSSSRQNHVVLCDYTGMEAYKSKSPVDGICESMSVLSRFPRQVIVLRNTAAIRLLKPAKAGLQRRLIDEVGTKGFSRFCTQIYAARSGDPSIAKEILAHAQCVRAFVDDAAQEASSFRSAIVDFAQEFSSDERSALRGESPWSIKLTRKFGDQFIDLLACFYDVGGLVVPEVTLGELRYTFTFRYVLCCYMLTLRWIARGCPPSNPDKIHNHMVDSALAAYATFFDGFLSRDVEAMTTYQRARAFLASS